MLKVVNHMLVSAHNIIRPSLNVVCSQTRMHIVKGAFLGESVGCKWVFWIKKDSLNNIGHVVTIAILIGVTTHKISRMGGLSSASKQ